MISAKIIADSIANNIRLVTMELNYPRFIHSELMTHRMFSRNASSSRAIPIEKMLEQVKNSPAMPVHWGKNQPGMQAREEFDGEDKLDLIADWGEASIEAIHFAQHFSALGVHKQVANRLLEPFQWIKVIVTATEWDNFFNLRLHPDAQPEIQELAKGMKKAMEESIPVELKPGEWHIPYVNYHSDVGYYDYNGHHHRELTKDEAIKCSVARCARVSYNNHDLSVPDVEKDIKLADMLLSAWHMSPFEHQATPMEKVNKYSDYDVMDYLYSEGITHMDKYKNYWSGNFRGWIQYRQLI